MAKVDPMLEERNVYLDLVEAARAGNFRPLPKEVDLLVDRALFASVSWCTRIFRVPVHQPLDNLEHAYRLADAKARIDLLEHQLTVESTPGRGKIRVKVYEAASFFVVFLPAAAFEISDPLAKAAQAANLLLELGAPAAFHFIPSDSSHRSFSTDPDRRAEHLGTWSNRIDGVLRGDEIALVIYKATYDDMMTMVSDPGDWFEELRGAPRH